LQQQFNYQVALAKKYENLTEKITTNVVGADKVKVEEMLSKVEEMHAETIQNMNMLNEQMHQLNVTLHGIDQRYGEMPHEEEESQEVEANQDLEIEDPFIGVESNEAEPAKKTKPVQSYTGAMPSSKQREEYEAQKAEKEGLDQEAEHDKGQQLGSGGS